MLEFFIVLVLVLAFPRLAAIGIGVVLVGAVYAVRVLVPVVLFGILALFVLLLTR